MSEAAPSSTPCSDGGSTDGMREADSGPFKIEGTGRSRNSSACPTGASSSTQRKPATSGRSRPTSLPRSTLHLGFSDCGGGGIREVADFLAAAARRSTPTRIRPDSEVCQPQGPVPSVLSVPPDISGLQVESFIRIELHNGVAIQEGRRLAACLVSPFCSDVPDSLALAAGTRWRACFWT